MYTKHVASGSAGAPKPKNFRKSITLETKLEILKKSNEGMWLKDREFVQHCSVNCGDNN